MSYTPFVWDRHNGLVLLQDRGCGGSGTAINNGGLVAGYVLEVDPGDQRLRTRAAVWINGVLSVITAGESDGAVGVTETGIVTGSISLTDDGRHHLFRWSQGVGLAIEGTCDRCVPTSIMADGSVVGTEFNESGRPVSAVVWQPNGTLVRVGDEPAWGIGTSDAGATLGTLNDSEFAPALLTGGHWSILPNPLSFRNYYSVTAINRYGDMSFQGVPPAFSNGRYWAGVWQQGSALQLSFSIVSGLSDAWARGLNSVGQVLLYGNTNTTNEHILVWRYAGVELGDISAEYGGQAVVQARLYSHSTPAAGKLATFYLANVVVGSAITDANGLATTTVDIAGLEVGNHRDALRATFAGDIEIAPSEATSDLIVQPRDPGLSWSAPAPIATTTPLGDAQLNASANVPGVFAYFPEPGSLLKAGRVRLTVNFTPLDTVHFRSGVADTSIDVIMQSAASDIREAEPTSNCAGEHDFALDEVHNLVLGISWTLPAVCIQGSTLQFEPVTGPSEFSWPRSVAVDSGRRRLYATDYASPTLFVFDTDTRALVDRITVSDFGTSLVADPWTGRVYIAGATVENSVMIVDVGLRAQIATIHGAQVVNAQGPTSLAIDATRKRVLWLSKSGLSILDIDVSSPTYHQVLQTIAAPDKRWLAVNRVTGRVYAASGGSYGSGFDSVETFAPGAGGYAVTGETRLVPYESSNFQPADVTRIAIDAARNILYARVGDYGCYSGCAEAIAGYDGDTLEMLSLLPLPDLGTSDGPMLVNPASHQIYLSLVLSNSVARTLVFTDAPALSTVTTPSKASVTTPSVSITFSSVTTSGQTTVTPLTDPAILLPAPGQYSFENGLAFDAHTTAQFAGTITLCFAAAASDPAVFDTLHLLHAENGAWIDRTTSRDYATGMICGTTTSLSPFVVARRTAPGIELRVLSDPTKVNKQGSTVPIKVQIWSGGRNISSPSLVVSAVEVRRTSDSTLGTLADSGNANPDLNFRYDGGGGYIFNMSTKSLSAGKYELRLKAGSDPTVLTTTVQLR